MATLPTKSCFVTVLSSCRRVTTDRRKTLAAARSAQRCGFAAVFRLRGGRARKRAAGARRGARARPRRPPRGRPRRPPRGTRARRRGGRRRRQRGASGGDDVLDQAHARPGSNSPSMRFAGAVLLRLVAHDQERQAGRERGGGGQRDGAELGPRERLASGSAARRRAAIRSPSAPSSSGRVSKRYLSRYQRERLPERSTKSPSSSACSAQRVAQLVGRHHARAASSASRATRASARACGDRRRGDIDPSS